MTQLRISDLVQGKINLFSLYTLMDMATTAGMAPTVKVAKLKAPVKKRLVQRKLGAA